MNDSIKAFSRQHLPVPSVLFIGLVLFLLSASLAHRRQRHNRNGCTWVGQVVLLVMPEEPFVILSPKERTQPRRSTFRGAVFQRAPRPLPKLSSFSLAMQSNNTSLAVEKEAQHLLPLLLCHMKLSSFIIMCL